MSLEIYEFTGKIHLGFVIQHTEISKLVVRDDLYFGRFFTTNLFT